MRAVEHVESLPDIPFLWLPAAPRSLLAAPILYAPPMPLKSQNEAVRGI